MTLKGSVVMNNPYRVNGLKVVSGSDGLHSGLRPPFHPSLP